MWIFIINVMKGVSLSIHLKVLCYMKCWIPPTSCSFQLTSIGAHPPVEQMYIMTGFMTLVHSYIQVTARLIDYILFVRALDVSMWKQLVKVLQLKYPTISSTNKLYEGNKKTLSTQTLHHKMPKLLCKIKKNFACGRLQTSLRSGNYW